MPRLLIDGTALSRGNKGVGRYSYQLCLQVARRLPQEWAIEIVIFPQELPQFPTGFRASFVTIPRASDLLKGLYVLPKLARRARADVMLRPMESAGYDFGISMITVCHDIPELIRHAARQPRGLWRRLVDGANEYMSVHAMRKSAMVVCNSAFIRDAVTARYGIDPAKTSIGYCGVDPRFYGESQRVQSDLVRLKYGIARYVLTFATGDYREGFDLLPEIGRELKARHARTCLLVAGVRAGAHYAETLRRQFLRWGLIEGQDFAFEGFLAEDRFADLAALYTAADFYLELSGHEGFGMQLAEAMACGTTCISTGRGALGEVAGKFAIDLEKVSVESVVSAIIIGYAQGSHVRNNRDQVEYTRRFNWQSVGRLVTECIERLGRSE